MTTEIINYLLIILPLLKGYCIYPKKALILCQYIFLLVSASYSSLEKSLESDGFSLVSIAENLVDKVWDDRPTLPTEKVIIQPMKFAG